MSIDFRSYTIHSGRPLTDEKPAAWGPTINSEIDGDLTTGGVGRFWELTHIDNATTKVVSKMSKDGILTIGKFATADLPDASLWEGSIVYDETVKKLKFSNGTAWEATT